MFLGQIGEQNLKNTSILNSNLIFLNSIVLEFFSLNCVRVEKHIYLLGFLVEGITYFLCVRPATLLLYTVL